MQLRILTITVIVRICVMEDDRLEEAPNQEQRLNLLGLELKDIAGIGVVMVALLYAVGWIALSTRHLMMGVEFLDISHQQAISVGFDITLPFGLAAAFYHFVKSLKKSSSQLENLMLLTYPLALCLICIPIIVAFKWTLIPPLSGVILAGPSSFALLFFARRIPESRILVGSVAALLMVCYAIFCGAFPSSNPFLLNKQRHLVATLDDGSSISGVWLAQDTTFLVLDTTTVDKTGKATPSKAVIPISHVRHAAYQ